MQHRLLRWQCCEHCALQRSTLLSALNSLQLGREGRGAGGDGRPRACCLPGHALTGLPCLPLCSVGMNEVTMEAMRERIIGAVSPYVEIESPELVEVRRRRQ